jgi:hypothetical protein
MTDIWVCSTCMSINRQRNDRCYKCGARQETATGALAETRSERAIQERAFNPYRSSLVFAIVASAFIVAVATLAVIVLSESLTTTRFIRDQIPVLLQGGEVDTAELARLSAGVVVPAQLQLVCAIGALLFFSVWLSRVVANVPALGGGDPGVTPMRAFITPLIPIYNLFKTPPIIQNALYRLDAKAGGFFMLLLAWLGLVGSWFVDYFVGLWVNLRIITVSFNADTLGEAIDAITAAYDLRVIVDIITTLMVSAGGLVLVIVIFRIERRARARDREIRAAFASGVGLGSLASGTTASDAPAVAPVGEGVPAAPAVAPAAPPPPVLAPAPPSAGGPRLIVRVGSDGIQASLDGDAWEPVTIDELRQAAPALHEAGGDAVVSSAGGEVSGETVFEIASALRASGVPTHIAGPS